MAGAQETTTTLTAYRVQPWPKGRGYKRYRAQNACHRNAWRLACDHPELTLVRGYMLMDLGLWIGHWWCADEDGGVVDPTLKNEGVAYVGVGAEVDRVAFAREVHETGYFNVGLDNIAHPDLVPALDAAREA